MYFRENFLNYYSNFYYFVLFKYIINTRLTVLLTRDLFGLGGGHTTNNKNEARIPSHIF